MSTEKTAPQEAAKGLVRRKFKVDHSGRVEQLVIKNIEVSSLKIDESLDVDCDPYNRTGQFLVDTLKKKRDE